MRRFRRGLMQLVVDGVKRTLRQVVFLAEMGEHNMLRVTTDESAQRLRAGLVGEMPVIRSNAPFERHRIRPQAQHLAVVISFNQQKIAVSERFEVVV